MKSLAALLVALAPFAVGCAGGVEYEQAEFPQQAVGYTPPQGAAAVAPATAQPQPAPQPQEGVAMQAEAQDVAIGAPATGGDIEYADQDPSALTDFRSTLDPYGTWVDDGTYGTVWVPSSTVVGADFAPYVSAGHWTYDNDYVWVSDYSWGWAPFHYGRWAYLGGRGWGWIPGRTYAGAWVTWRVGYDDWGYVGWAPLPPTWYWNGGYAYGIAVVPAAPYVFCAHGDLFYGGGLGGRIVTGSQVGVVAGHTRPYVAASPTVGAGGRVAAHPTVGGPAPSSLRIPAGSVVAPPTGDRGLAQARAFAHPGTAQPLGARPPAQAMAHNGTTPYGRGPATAGTPSTPGARAPYAGQPYSHTPPTNGYRPSTPGYRPATPPTAHAAPTYRPPAYYGQTPHYAPSTPYSPSTPHYGPSTPYAGSTPHYAPSAPHYAPSAPAAPHYAPSAPSGTYHAPSGGSSYRPSTGGGYHPSGGGGFRGGGGGRGGRR